MNTPPDCSCGGAPVPRASVRERPVTLLASGLSLALGLFAVLAPKCPMCLAAYLSVVGLGVTGAGFFAPLLAPLGAALLVVALVPLALQRSRGGR